MDHPLIILHHYPRSPFAEKIRITFGMKGIHWRSVEQPRMASIKSNLALWSSVQNAWYGLSLGSVLLLAAIGLAITFGVMGVINMAHGEMVMIGAYTTFVVQDAIRTYQPAMFGYSLLIAVPLAFLVAGGIGVLVERTIIRFLYGRPLETLLATWRRCHHPRLRLPCRERGIRRAMRSARHHVHRPYTGPDPTVRVEACVARDR